MFSDHIKCWLLIALLIVITGEFSGCATSASNTNMLVNNMFNFKKHPITVSVLTQGGSETGISDSYGISDEDFAKAIGESIIKNGLFKNVNYVPGPGYVLSVTVVEMSKPILGPNHTVNMEAAWSLTRAPGGEIFMKRSIKSSNTATFGEAPVGTTRRRLAMERAIRENIQAGLAEIGKLDLN